MSDPATKPPETQAPPPATGTLSALDAAVVNDNLADYRTAWNAEKKGEPLPAVAKPGVLDEDTYKALRDRQSAGDFLTDSERKSLRITSRVRRQEEINDRARGAAQKVVDEYETKLKEATEKADKLAKELEAARQPRVPANVEAATVGRPVAVPPPVAPATELTAPDPNDTQKYPGGVYDPQYIEDKAVFRFKTEQAEADRQRQELQTRETNARSWTEAKVRFSEGLKLARESDPEFATVMNGDLAAKHLVPVEEFQLLKANKMIPAEAQPGPMNFLATYLVGHSAIGYQLLKHFHQHPDVLTRVLAEGPPALYRLEGELIANQKASPPAAAVASSAPAPSPRGKVVTDAPPPPPVMGTREAAPTDPVQAAVRDGKGSLTGGTRDYFAARRAEMAGSRK